MSNVFRNKMPIEKPNRNTFDLSFANNLTMKFGALYPVFCKEVIPGDSFHINADFGLRFMPMVFPVQTRMKAYLHFFYVRNRNLWTNWKKFITATDSTVADKFPVIDFTKDNGKKLLETGSLGDYLGLPTTLVTGTGSVSSTRASAISLSGLGLNPIKTDGIGRSNGMDNDSVFIWHSITFADNATNVNAPGTSYWFYTSDSFGTSATLGGQTSANPPKLEYLLGSLLQQKNGDIVSCLYDDIDLLSLSIVDTTKFVAANFYGVGVVRLSYWAKVKDTGELYYLMSSSAKSVNSTSATSVEFEVAPNLIDKLKTRIMTYGLRPSDCSVVVSLDVMNRVDFVTTYTDTTRAVDSNDLFKTIGQSSFDVTDLGATQVKNKKTTKVLQSTYTDLKISALPFRAYQAIYNSFYRNILNDPLMINGQAEYDKFILNDGDGADSTDYPLYYRNWEDDFLTMALPSPQQGIAPLLGVSYSNHPGAIMRITHDGVRDDTSLFEYIKVGYDSGNKMTFNMLSTESPNNGNLQGFVDLLNDASTFGISINDLRNVNSLQRWLEKNSARGFRYKEQIMSHFGVDLTFELCDMPEFLGGYTKDVQVSQVTQTSEGSMPLGSYAGQGYCIGQQENSINKYCDEHGFIIGILSVAPVPAYSQLLPKMFLKNKHLDYFSPEFSKIGYQPVQYKEVCPVQAKNDGINLNKVFGYQRPWYDYLASVDEVHGGFRNDDLRDFLVNRTFATTPQLSSDFLHVNPDEVNDIFAVTTDSDDKILGQIYFDVKAKRPIPEMVNPGLE